ncbi:hypothetical protein E2562_018681 [Oryza meyeriana var. granulata]|uniref:Retroviral polymerase SH3-like domain-containing protein n=1 Tax=Oryza meyeriana var. granulata TaxID=110450 RepID=A0A6G1EMM8_9ORYZ|nr:hypothetical protein E2562_018681 [Oryza meyeriana var. granulata]
MIFVGYEHGAKAYRCYDPASRGVVVPCDVVFDEAAQWDWSTEDGGGQVDDEPFTVKYTTDKISYVDNATCCSHASDIAS